MARPFLSPSVYARQRQQAATQAERRDAERLKDLGDRIARQRAKRQKPSTTQVNAVFRAGRP